MFGLLTPASGGKRLTTPVVTFGTLTPGQIPVQWTNPTGATHFLLYRSLIDALPVFGVDTPIHAVDVPYWIDTTVLPVTEYFYSVIAQGYEYLHSAPGQNSVTSLVKLIIGELFNKSTYTALTDNWDLTNAGGCATLNGSNQLVLTGSGTFDKSIILKNTTSTDQQWKVSVKFRTTVDSTSYGFIIAAKSINTWSAPDAAMHFKFYTAELGVLTLMNTVGTNFLSNTDAFTVNDTDLFQADFEMDEFTFTGTLTNLTTSATKSLSYRLVSSADANFQPINSKQIRLYACGGIQVIDEVDYTSNSWAYPDVAFFGDSKTIARNSVLERLRFSSIIRDITGLKVSNYGGNADRTVELAQSVDYCVANVTGNVAVVCIGRNDIASVGWDSAAQTRYAGIITKLRTVFTTIIHLLPIPEIVVADQSAINTFITTNYSGDIIIDPAIGWDSSMLSTDNIHENILGEIHIADKLLPEIYPFAPILQTASIAYSALDTINLVYDRPINTGTGLATSDFTVPGKTVSSISINNKTISVFLSTSFAVGDTVTVSGGGNKIKGLDGLVSTNLSNQSVTNVGGVYDITGTNLYVDGNNVLLTLASGYGTSPFVIPSGHAGYVRMKIQDFDYNTGSSILTGTAIIGLDSTSGAVTVPEDLDHGLFSLKNTTSPAVYYRITSGGYVNTTVPSTLNDIIEMSADGAGTLTYKYSSNGGSTFTTLSTQSYSGDLHLKVLGYVAGYAGLDIEAQVTS